MWPGMRARVAGSVKWSPTRPSWRSEWNCRPSKLTMPAASWPRCCSAWRPSAVSAAASGWPRMPNTPHSSRRVSPSRSSKRFVSHEIILGSPCLNLGKCRSKYVMTSARRRGSLGAAWTSTGGASPGDARVLALVGASSASPVRPRLRSRRRGPGEVGDLLLEIVGQDRDQRAAPVVEHRQRLRLARPVRQVFVVVRALAPSSQVPKITTTMAMRMPRSDAEDEAERAVERADAAVDRRNRRSAW